MKDERMIIKAIKENGEEVECDVILTFESNETNKSYIVYTDDSTDEDGNTRAYASIYDPNDEELKLYPIETEREWKIVETVLEASKDEINSMMGDSE